MMDKIELIKKLTSLEGLTDEERSSLIELLQKRKKYGLVWEDSHEHAVDELKEKLPILREVVERRILNDTDLEHYPNHILIEGENLQALIALTYTHGGMIDVIYLDPPYNTGNKDFVYNDSFICEDDEYRHSKWLSFMEKRLKIAKTLLSEKGVIFISIDDNEQANLKLLCDEVFGYESFMGNISWQRTYSPRNDKKGIVREVEYIAVYSKNPDWTPKKLERTAEMDAKYKNPDNDFAPWTSDNPNAPGAATHQGMVYAIQHPFTGELLYPAITSCWRYQQDEMLRIMQGWAPYELKDIDDAPKRAEICGIAPEEVRAGVMAIMLAVPLEEAKSSAEAVLKRGQWPKFYFTKNGKGGIRRKTYLQNVEGRIITNLWPYEEVGHTDEAKKELKKLFDGNAPFDTPKPTRLIQRIEQIASDSNSIILDFFAGSGTTMQATIQQNSEDGGHRQCILITKNENGICENVTYERNKRVICGYTTPKGQLINGLSKNNLRYYKVKGIPRDNSIRNRMKLAAGSIDMLCIMENLYQEKHSFGDMGHYKGLRYFEEEGRGMLVVLNTDLIPLIVEQLKGMKLVTPLHIYMYAPGDYAFDDEFEEVGSKVEIYPLPQPILNSYKQWLPKQDEVKLEIPDDYELSEAEQNESGEDFITKEG